MQILTLAALALLPQVPTVHTVHLDLRFPDGTVPKAAEIQFQSAKKRNTFSMGHWAGPGSPVRLVGEAGTLIVYVDPIEMSLPALMDDRFPTRTTYARLQGRLVAPWASAPVTVDLGALDPDEPLEIELAPVPHARITLEPAKGDLVPDDLMIEAAMPGFRGSSDDMGRYTRPNTVPNYRIRDGVAEFYGLEVGEERTVNIGIEGRPPLATVTLEGSDEITDYTVELPPLPGVEEVSVRYRVSGLPELLNESSQPHPTRYSWGAGGSVNGEHCTVTEDGDGWRVVYLGEREPPSTPEAERTTQALAVRASGFGMLAAPVEPGCPPIEFAFVPPVHVTLRRTQGSSEGLEYVLTPKGLPGVTVLRATAEKDSVFVGPVQPGRYVLEVKDPRRRGGSGLPMHTQEIVLRRGVSAETVDVELAPRVDVYVESRTLPRGMQIELVPAGTPPGMEWLRGARATLDSGGRASFRDVADVAYEVRASGWARPLRVPQDLGRQESEPVPFDTPVTCVARVRVSDPKGDFGRAGLRDGDLVRGVHGEPFASPHAARRFALDARKAPVVLMVTRGDETLEIELKATDPGRRAVAFGELLGGSIEPAWVD